MEAQVFSVSQVAAYVKHLFKNDAALYNLNVEGEISDCKVSGGHAYFTIKDESCQLSCVQFGAGAGFRFRVGDKVIVCVRADYYEKTGRLSFIASAIRSSGQGDLWQKYLQLKEKLERQGLFEPGRKKPIPKYPRRIGVVTSEKGAVIRDIIRVVGRRNPTVDIVLYPAKVQGEGAEAELCEGIDFFDGYDVDTVILARGGGSMEDLAPFYSERVAMKVSGCKKPIISAVGHETDFSLCDFTADLRAATPSVAAELAVTPVSEMIQEIYAASSWISDCCSKRFERCGNALKNTVLRLNVCAESTEKRAAKELDGAVLRLYEGVSKRIDGGERLIAAAGGRLYARINERFLSKDKEVSLLMEKLGSLNPLSLLRKGYAKAMKENISVQSVSQVQPGDKIDVYVRDGRIACSVENTSKMEL